MKSRRSLVRPESNSEPPEKSQTAPLSKKQSILDAQLGSEYTPIKNSV